MHLIHPACLGSLLAWGHDALSFLLDTVLIQLMAERGPGSTLVAQALTSHCHITRQGLPVLLNAAPHPTTELCLPLGGLMWKSLERDTRQRRGTHVRGGPGFLNSSQQSS